MKLTYAAERNCLWHITLGQEFSQVNLPNLCSGRIDGRDAFQAAFCFKDHISSPTKLSTKHTNNSSVIGHGMTPK